MSELRREPALYLSTGHYTADSKSIRLYTVQVGGAVAKRRRAIFGAGERPLYCGGHVRCLGHKVVLREVIHDKARSSGALS
jgi:hypothetical protein